MALGPKIFDVPIPRATTEALAQESFEDMVKFVVDLRRKKICAGGGLHADEEQLLLENGSLQKDLWGANYYWGEKTETRWEYTSMINIRPDDHNRGQLIESSEIRDAVRELGTFFFESLR